MSTEMRRYRRYPQYKDSGVEWMGDVPRGWQLTKMWDATTAVSGGTPPKEDPRYWNGGIPWVSPKDMKRTFIDSSEDSVSGVALRECGLKLVPPPAILIVVRGMILAHSFPVGLTTVPATINQDMKALILDGRLDARFFAYWLSGVGPALLDLIVDEAAHGTKAIRMDRWRTLPVAVPSEREQHAIGEFLDRETAKIDALVVKKERLIALLHEKRSALITRAVTKGLDPNVPKKDSGVEWLGMIPIDWDVMRLRHVGEAVIGLTYEPGDVCTEEDGVLVLRASNVTGGRITLEDRTYVRREIPPRLITRAGDILICSRSGSRALIGKNARIDSSSAGLSFGAFMTVFRSRLNDYLYYAFNSRLFEYQSASFFTSTINQLTLSNLYDFAVPIPPPRVRQDIVEHLDHQTRRFDALIARIKDALERLYEIRTALIFAAVTGKIDVREELA